MANKDLENKFIHCDIETNLPDSNNLIGTSIKPLEDAGKDGYILDIQKVDDVAEWNISGRTNTLFDEVNHVYLERETSVYIRSGESESPRMTIRQHRKPDDYNFAHFQARLANAPITEEKVDLTIGQKGGRVILSAYSIINNNEDRRSARVDDFNLKIHNVYAGVISQIGSAHEVDDVNGKRVEWILNISRNDNFDSRNAILFCEFTNENTGKKEFKSITIRQEAREHTYTKPVLNVSATDIDCESHIIEWEAYYTIDGIKQKIDTFTVNGLSPDDEQVCYIMSIQKFSDGMSGRFHIEPNYDDEDLDALSEVRSFEIRAIVTGETGEALGEYLGVDGNKSETITIWQDNYTPIRYDYKFEVTPYYLPSTAVSVDSRGIKTWENHVPYNSDTYYIKVLSTRKKQEEVSEWASPTENYISGVTVSVISGGAYIQSSGWSGSDEYKIELKEYNSNVTTNTSRTVVLQFNLKDDNNTIIKKVQYKINQLDKYCHPLFMYSYNAKTEPSHILLSMGSDLLTGKGFGVSAKITNTTKGVVSVGSTSTEIGDSGDMTLYWGGTNSNDNGNQYISFSPKSYTESSQKNITLSVSGKTLQEGISRGVVSIKAETLSTKPTAQKSGKYGVNNILLPSGTQYNKVLCHGRMNGSNNTKLFEVIRYWQNGSIFIKQIPNATPKYSLSPNRSGINLLSAISTKVNCEQGATISMVDNEIKSSVISGSTELCGLLSKNDNVMSASTSLDTFDSVELYYDSTDYRLCGIGIILQGSSNYSVYYNSTNLSSFNPREYNFTQSTCAFVFEPSDDLSESVAEYTERNVSLYNISESNHYPYNGFNGMIYDPVTKQSTTYTISSAASGLQPKFRTIRWKDISNNSTDSSRKLKLLSISTTEGNKIVEDSFSWTLKGFKNSVDEFYDSDSHTYSPIETFQYAFNSSTPRLEIGLQDNIENTIHTNVRFFNMNSINGKFIGDSEYKPFTDVNVSYEFFRWTPYFEPNGFDNSHKVDECVESGALVRLYDPINGYRDENWVQQQKFQILNATSYDGTNISAIPNFDIYFQENTVAIEDRNIMVVRFTISDITNYDTPGKVRAVIVGYFRLGKIRAQAYMKIDCSTVFEKGIVTPDSGSVNDKQLFYCENIGEKAIITVFSPSEL